MSPEQLSEALAAGEQRHVEFKAEGALNDAYYVAKVVRAVMAMANRSYGGSIVLGVDDKAPLRSPGMSSANETAWTSFDDVADKIAKYANEVDFVATRVALNGNTHVVIRVAEFREIPVICKKSFDKPGGGQVLRAGAIYVRSADGKIQTREVDNESDMRRLVDLASEKRLRGHIERTSRAGGMIVPAEATPSAAAEFDAELGDLA